MLDTSPAVRPHRCAGRGSAPSAPSLRKIDQYFRKKADFAGSHGGLLFWDEVKEERWHRFMQAQQKISTRRLKRKVGTRQQVIIDEIGPSVAKGRSMADAPEIDGAVYVASHRPLRVGEIATVKIERADEYDLYGTAVGF